MFSTILTTTAGNVDFVGFSMPESTFQIFVLLAGYLLSAAVLMYLRQSKVKTYTRTAANSVANNPENKGAINYVLARDVKVINTVFVVVLSLFSALVIANFIVAFIRG